MLKLAFYYHVALLRIRHLHAPHLEKYVCINIFLQGMQPNYEIMLSKTNVIPKFRVWVTFFTSIQSMYLP